MNARAILVFQIYVQRIPHHGRARRRNWPRNHGCLPPYHPGGGRAHRNRKSSKSARKSTCSGNTAGIEPSAWESLRRTKVFYKAPITTPQGGGFKSLNVTTRKMLGLYANVRPCVSYHPFVKTKHPNMDIVIVRENEEDCYAGMEYQLSDTVMECLKIITRPGSERIVRYAFEYALQHNRKKVTCFTKDNIMKMTDGLFHKIFDEIGAEYPDHRKRTLDRRYRRRKNGRHARCFRRHRDAESLWRHSFRRGRADRRIGWPRGLRQHRFAMRHVRSHPRIRPAPRRPEPGQSLRAPAGRRFDAGALDQPDIAERVHNAWLCTMEDGVHTYDVFKEGTSKQKVGTKEFARSGGGASGQERRIRSRPCIIQPLRPRPRVPPKPAATPAKVTVDGIDVYVAWPSLDTKHLAAADAEGRGRWPGPDHDRQSRREGLAGRHGRNPLHGQPIAAVSKPRTEPPPSRP